MLAVHEVILVHMSVSIYPSSQRFDLWLHVVLHRVVISDIKGFEISKGLVGSSLSGFDISVVKPYFIITAVLCPYHMMVCISFKG